MRCFFLRTFFFLTICCALSLQGQNINQYKYVVIPESYAFLKNQNDKYQLNSLTNFLFEKYGFTTYFKATTFPDDLTANGCLALYADVLSISSLLTMKLRLALKDCYGTEVFISEIGKSKEKDFKKGYQQALRNAFTSIQRLHYNYQPKTNTAVSEVSKPVQTETSQERKKAFIDANRDLVGHSKEQVTQHVPKAVVPLVSKASVVRYQLQSKTFTLKALDNKGYIFSEIIKGKPIVLGKLYKSARENAFIVKASEWSGHGYFDGYGNFVVERINPATDSLITDVFARVDKK